MSYYYSNLEFPKTGSEIKEKASKLIKKLQAKVEERKRLVAEAAKQLGIESVEDALTRAEEIGIELSDENQVAHYQVAHSKMLANRNRARGEQEEIRKLEMIVRNLPDDKVYDLNFDSLEFFGF